MKKATDYGRFLQSVDKVAKTKRFYKFECIFLVVNDSSTIIIAVKITTHIVKNRRFLLI